MSSSPASAERMDGEACDEVTVLGSRYRVVRADKFLRSGPDGPSRRAHRS